MSRITRVLVGALALGWGSQAAAQGVKLDVHAGADVTQVDGFNTTGATYGLSLSYDANVGRAVLGAQLDVDATDNRGCERDLIIPGDRACIDARRDAALSLRAGVRLSGTTAIYALAGYANGRFDASYSGAGVTERENRAFDGVRVGAGVEASFGRRWFGKVEYRYTNYEDDLSRHGAVLGIGLRF